MRPSTITATARGIAGHGQAGPRHEPGSAHRDLDDLRFSQACTAAAV
jgi:hypothetical protein